MYIGMYVQVCEIVGPVYTAMRIGHRCHSEYVQVCTLYMYVIRTG